MIVKSTIQNRMTGAIMKQGIVEKLIIHLLVLRLCIDNTLNIKLVGNLGMVVASIMLL